MNALDPQKSLFQQMIDERLALAEQARLCGSPGTEVPDEPVGDAQEIEGDEPLVPDTKLIGLHLEDLVAGLDDDRKHAERALKRLYQIIGRIRKGQDSALVSLRQCLGLLMSMEVAPPRVVADTERDEILQSMAALHGSRTPPEGSVYRLYREDLATSFFVFGDGRVLALKDGTVGSVQDKDDLIALVVSELHARGTIFAKGIDDLKSALDETKFRFASQLGALSATLTMQQS